MGKLLNFRAPELPFEEPINEPHAVDDRLPTVVPQMRPCEEIAAEYAEACIKAGVPFWYEINWGPF